MRIKKGVDVFGLKPEMVIVSLVVNDVCHMHGVECCLTSVRDGSPKRSPKSLHRFGFASDYSIQGVKNKPVFAEDIRSRLPDDYDVVLESDHVHVEYDPK